MHRIYIISANSIGTYSIIKFYDRDDGFRIADYSYLSEGLNYKDISFDLTMTEGEVNIAKFNEVMAKRL